MCLELGHVCNVKDHIWGNPSYSTKEFNEATHDWEFFIRDSNKGDMTQYIDKIVVNLHETFKNPKRGDLVSFWAEFSWMMSLSFFPVLKEPPFVVREQGYAGFTIYIEIFFKGVPEGDEARKVCQQKSNTFIAW